MISVPMPAFDVTDLLRAATEYVQHEDPLQALYALCGLETTPVKSGYMARAHVVFPFLTRPTLAFRFANH